MKISILPRFVALKSKLNNKYLQLVRRQEGEGESQGRLQFTGEEVASPLAKFEVVMAKSDRRFVHLKCCSNNKYWVVASSSSDGVVAAAADKPEEDQSMSSCTLFHPMVADEDGLNSFRFKSVSHGKYAVLQQDLLGCTAAEPEGDLSDALEAVDWWKVATTDHEDPTMIRSDQVNRRHIYNVRFHTNIGVITNVQDVQLAMGLTAINNSDEFSTMNFSTTVLSSITYQWINSNPANLGFPTDLTSGTPRVDADGRIYILPADGTIVSYPWGQIRSDVSGKTVTAHVILPPRRRVRVSVIATEIICEVPFSYTQSDYLSDGTEATYNFDDGTCTSGDDFNLRVETTLE